MFCEFGCVGKLSVQVRDSKSDLSDALQPSFSHPESEITNLWSHHAVEKP